MDISPSGAKFKVPSAFNYKLGEIIAVRFVELAKNSEVEGLNTPINYRIVGIDESYENDAVKYLRLLKLDETTVVEEVIEDQLKMTPNVPVTTIKTRSSEHVLGDTSIPS